MSRPRKVSISRQELFDAAWNTDISKRLNIRQMANKFNCSPDTINRLMAEYDIPVMGPQMGPVKSSYRSSGVKHKRTAPSVPPKDQTSL